MPIRYYAVANGRTNGLFTTWDECKESVNGYPNAKYKSFTTQKEATTYLQDHNKAALLEVLTPPKPNARETKKRGTFEDHDTCALMPSTAKRLKPSPFINDNIEQPTSTRATKDDDNNVLHPASSTSSSTAYIFNKSNNIDSATAPALILYTDGACPNNQSKAKRYAGVGVHFALTDAVKYYTSTHSGSPLSCPADISEPLLGQEQTNNRAEITAVIRGLEASPKGVPLLIYSDSQYVVKGITSWMAQWAKSNWKKSTGEAVLNKDLWCRIMALIKDHGGKDKVKIQHVRAHCGIPGNEKADRLAVLGSVAKRPPT